MATRIYILIEAAVGKAKPSFRLWPPVHALYDDPEIPSPPQNPLHAARVRPRAVMRQAKGVPCDVGRQSLGRHRCYPFLLWRSMMSATAALALLVRT